MAGDHRSNKKLRLRHFGIAGDEDGLGTVGLGGKQGFRNEAFGLAEGVIRDGEDRLRASVVFFQPINSGVREASEKSLQAIDERAAERKNGLGIIADDHDVSMIAAQQLHDGGLDPCRILIFIHEDRLILMAKAGACRLAKAQEFIEQEEQVVVVESMLLPFALGIAAIERRELWGVGFHPWIGGGDDVGDGFQRIGDTTEETHELCLFRESGSCAKATFACEEMNEAVGVIFIH